jgi:hypothetical protein
MPGQLLPGQRRLGRLVPEFGRLLQVPRLLRWSRCSSAVAPLWSVSTQTRQIPVRTRDLRYTPRTHVHSDATEENDGLSDVWMGILGQDRRPLVASGAALALANATAYSSIVIDPVVIAFAFLVWLPRVSARHTGYWAVWFGAVWLALFSLLMTVSGSWAGLAFTVLNRKRNDYEMPIVILGDIARSAGFIIVIALIGVAVAIRTEERSRRGLLVLVGAAALFVPAAQLHFQTSWALDKHLAFGVWFASMAAGYGCLMARRWLARAVKIQPGVVASAGGRPVRRSGIRLAAGVGHPSRVAQRDLVRRCLQASCGTHRRPDLRLVAETRSGVLQRAGAQVMAVADEGPVARSGRSSAQRLEVLLCESSVRWQVRANSAVLCRAALGARAQRRHSA